MLVDTAFQYPADLLKAWNHRLANRIFKGITEQSQNNARCECCDKRLGEVDAQTSCWYSPINQLVFLGPGVPLLFVFIQNGAMTLITFALVFAIYAIISNWLGTSCMQSFNKCVNDIFNKLSLSNKITDNQSVMVQTYLIAGFLFIFFFLTQLMLFRVRKNNEICDEIIDSPSDYSIIIKNLPPQVKESDIQLMINDFRILLNQHQRQITNNLEVKKIIVSHSLRKYLKQKQKQEKEFLKFKKQNKDGQFQRKLIQRPTKTGSFAIVIFDKQVSKEMFVDEYTLEMKFKRLFVNCCEQEGKFLVNEKAVIIKRAPQPDDIAWENSDIPKSELYRNVFISYFLGVIILFSGGVIQYFLQYSQIRLKDSYYSSYFSYAASIIVTIYNAIIVQFLAITTKLQGHRTKTELDESLLIKICLYSFFNTGIFYSFANILAQQIHNFDIQGDFSFQITLFMVLNAVQAPLTNFLLTYLEFPAFIFRYLVKKGCLIYTQKEANQLFELTSVDFPIKYAYVIKTVWLTCFFAPFAPVVVPISILGLFIFYLTEAELFRTSYKMPNMISLYITNAAMRLLEFTGIIMTGGQFLITFYIKYLFQSSFNAAEEAGLGLCLGISIVLIIFPARNINERFFQFSNKFEKETRYDEASKEFQTTYEITNPLSQQSEINRKKSQVNLFKFLKVFEQVQMGEFRSHRASTKPLFDILLHDNIGQK